MLWMQCHCMEKPTTNKRNISAIGIGQKKNWRTRERDMSEVWKRQNVSDRFCRLCRCSLFPYFFRLFYSVDDALILLCWRWIQFVCAVRSFQSVGAFHFFLPLQYYFACLVFRRLMFLHHFSVVVIVAVAGVWVCVCVSLFLYCCFDLAILLRNV